MISIKTFQEFLWLIFFVWVQIKRRRRSTQDFNLNKTPRTRTKFLLTRNQITYVNLSWN